MHVIVGQGHLDDILNAGPEARRALIEEAAGVLKHRRRKEKALRKLEAMQANMTRLVDLTNELGRQLKPLGRQAQLARKAAVIQADLRDARLRLLADDYVTLSAELARDEAEETAAAALRGELDAVLTSARLSESDLEAAALQHAPRLTAAQETYFALGGLAERLRAVADLASERHKHLSAPPEPVRPGRDPDELEREAAVLREQERALSDRLGASRDQLALAVSARTSAEAALAEAERKIAADAREAAERAERLARLRSQAGAARSRLAAAQEEAGRLASVLAAARARAERAQQQYGELQDHFGGRDEDRAELAAAHERAAAAVTAASAHLARLRTTEHEVSDRRAGLRARAAAPRIRNLVMVVSPFSPRVPHRVASLAPIPGSRWNCLLSHSYSTLRHQRPFARGTALKFRFTPVYGRENIDLELQVVSRDKRQRRLFGQLPHVVRRSSGRDAHLIADFVDSKKSQSPSGAPVNPGFKQLRDC
jgi:chromosome segregation protein